MAKLKIMETSISIEPLLDLDNIMSRQPTRNLTLGNILGFKNSSYSALKKQRKNGAWIIREAYLLNDICCRRGKNMAIMRPSRAGKSNGSFLFTCGEMSHKAYHAVSRAISPLISCLLFFSIQGLKSPNHFTSYAIVIAAIAAAALLVKLLQIPKHWKWLINLFKGTHCVKDRPEEICKPHKTSASPNPIWSLIDKDLLCTADFYRIDSFVFSLCILLAWGVLCRLFLCIRRFYSKNVRKRRSPHNSDF